MRVAIVGSRQCQGLSLEELSFYVPDGCSQILSGGAEGVDALAREYAQLHGIAYREYLPQYQLYGKAAPVVRSQQLVEESDYVLAFWDKLFPWHPANHCPLFAHWQAGTGHSHLNKFVNIHSLVRMVKIHSSILVKK